MAEAAAFAKRPPVISHTGARALIDHPRNTSDETIRAVADKGGVVGVYFMPFLTLDSHPRGEDLLRHVLEHGSSRPDRTGTGSRSVFGHQMRYDLQQGFPLITTKRVHVRSIVALPSLVRPLLRGSSEPSPERLPLL